MLTRQQFLARCTNAYDVGRANPEALRILDRWADMVMRLEGGQMDYFTDLWQQEKERLHNFYVKLAGDTEGYQAIEFMAILTHPCQACATSPSAWWTRAGFCDHTEEERSGAQLPAVTQRQRTFTAEQLAKLREQLDARREMRARTIPVQLEMLDSLLTYIDLLEKARDLLEQAESA